MTGELPATRIFGRYEPNGSFHKNFQPLPDQLQSVATEELVAANGSLYVRLRPEVSDPETPWRGPVRRVIATKMDELKASGKITVRLAGKYNQLERRSETTRKLEMYPNVIYRVSVADIGVLFHAEPYKFLIMEVSAKEANSIEMLPMSAGSGPRKGFKTSKETQANMIAGEDAQALQALLLKQNRMLTEQNERLAAQLEEQAERIAQLEENSGAAKPEAKPRGKKGKGAAAEASAAPPAPPAPVPVVLVDATQASPSDDSSDSDDSDDFPTP